MRDPKGAAEMKHRFGHDKRLRWAGDPEYPCNWVEECRICDWSRPSIEHDWGEHVPVSDDEVIDYKVTCYRCREVAIKEYSEFTREG